MLWGPPGKKNAILNVQHIFLSLPVSIITHYIQYENNDTHFKLDFMYCMQYIDFFSKEIFISEIRLKMTRCYTFNISKKYLLIKMFDRHNTGDCY